MLDSLRVALRGRGIFIEGPIPVPAAMVFSEEEPVSAETKRNLRNVLASMKLAGSYARLRVNVISKGSIGKLAMRFPMRNCPLTFCDMWQPRTVMRKTSSNSEKMLMALNGNLRLSFPREIMSNERRRLNVPAR